MVNLHVDLSIFFGYHQFFVTEQSYPKGKIHEKNNNIKSMYPVSMFMHANECLCCIPMDHYGLPGCR